MAHCCWGHHCPYHCFHHGYYPGWSGPFHPPPPPPYPPPPADASRDDYVRRLEAEREMLEGRLRRLEDQLAELQRRERAG